MSRRADKGRLPPFVALLKETMASPAWRALSHGARSLYIALKARYSSNFHNNGKIWVSQRDARRELGSGFEEIGIWFRELEFYGFIVQTRAGGLGVEGRGKSPHWRLTECGFMRDPPTRDFMRWDGKKFERPRRPGRSGKQNPAPERRSRVLRQGGAPLLRKGGAPKAVTATPRRCIQQDPTATQRRSITIKPLHSAQQGAPEPVPVPSLDPEKSGAPTGEPGERTWTTPVLTEITDPAEIAAIRAEATPVSAELRQNVARRGWVH